MSGSTPSCWPTAGRVRERDSAHADVASGPDNPFFLHPRFARAHRPNTTGFIDSTPTGGPQLVRPSCSTHVRQTSPASSTSKSRFRHRAQIPNAQFGRAPRLAGGARCFALARQGRGEVCRSRRWDVAAGHPVTGFRSRLPSTLRFACSGPAAETDGRFRRRRTSRTAPRRRRRSPPRREMLSSTFLDEVGYLAYDARAADLLFQLVSRRYEHRSLLITTNLPFKRWDTVPTRLVRRRTDRPPDPPRRDLAP